MNVLTREEQSRLELQIQAYYLVMVVEASM
jgi:hypothetical protein